MKNPVRFSLLADALMASLASRSFEWREWRLGEHETRSPGQDPQVKTWIRVVVAEGRVLETELDPSASPSLALHALLHSSPLDTPSVREAWPRDLDKLPPGPDPAAEDAAEGTLRRTKDSLGCWGEKWSKY